LIIPPLKTLHSPGRIEWANNETQLPKLRQRGHKNYLNSQLAAQIPVSTCVVEQFLFYNVAFVTGARFLKLDNLCENYLSIK